MFKLITSTKSRDAKRPTRGASIATVKGNLYRFSVTTGNIEVADATTLTNREVLIASQNLVADTTSAHFVVALQGDTLIADTVANTAPVQVGQRVLLNATGDMVNNTGTDAPTGLFQIMAVVGLPAARKVTVKKL